jgi:CRISPR-associated protein Csd1
VPRHGRTAPIAPLHELIRRVRGAQSTGARLVSFNLPAFASHGKSPGESAPVSRDAQFAYTTALNTRLTWESGGLGQDPRSSRNRIGVIVNAS